MKEGMNDRYLGSNSPETKKPCHFSMTRLFVGVSGFEPEAPCSQSRCANRTALHPVLFFSERLQR